MKRFPSVTLFSSKNACGFYEILTEKGTLIIVSHDSGAIINLCDRALWLNAGRLQKIAAPNDVVDAYMANLYELRQGKSDPQFRNKIDPGVVNLPVQANDSHEIGKIFNFDPNAPGFGTGDAIIQDVFIENEQGIRIHRVSGGEKICVCISALIKSDVEQPIFGFQVKDRLGQVIFGNNSYLKYENFPVVCQRNDLVTAKFTFVMPVLTAGVYAVQAAIANGTMTNHIQLHWIHDAMVFDVQAANERQVYFDGMVYVPIEKIEIDSSIPFNEAISD